MTRRPQPHTYLTALSPIEYRADDPHNRLRDVREMLHTHEQTLSPFRDCPMVHMVRLQIIDTLRPAMGDMTGVALQSSYLLLAAELDGNADDFLDCLYRVGSDFVAAVWGRCIGYPPYAGAVFFRRYIARCRIDDPLPYAAFDNSVGQILRAAEKKELLADWLTSVEGLEGAELQRAWRDKRSSFENPTLPKPGTF